MASLDLKSRRVLLVDSSGNLRWMVKDLLEGMGFGEVSTHNINQTVLETLTVQSFDLILVGHNVHDRYSGLQLLEEARFRGLIKPTCSWLLMTSDASQQSVLFAIETQPDEVICKPFTMEMIKRRILQLCRRKQLVEPIEQAVERRAFNRAIALCDSLVGPSDPAFTLTRRIKGRLLMDQGRHAEAREVYEGLYWADQGAFPALKIAECDFHLGQADAAEKRLRELLGHYPLLIPAYELLALIQEQRGDYAQAEEVLARAARESPLVIERQMHLGRLGMVNGNLDTAARAFRRSIHLGDLSCHATADAYLKLANVNRIQMQNAEPGERQAYLNEIESLINRAQRKFSADPSLGLKSELLRAQVEETLGNPDAVQKHYEKAQELTQSQGKPVDLQRLKEVLLDQRLPATAAPAASRAAVEETTSSDASKVKLDPATSDKVNRIGIRNYLAGRQGQAIRYFNLAFDYNPRNAQALLNQAQLFLEGARDYPARSEARMKMFRRYMRLAQRLPLEGEVKQRLEALAHWSRQPLEELPEGMLAPLLK